MCLQLGGIHITLCVIRSMSDEELRMRFESANSVTKLFKLLHFVTPLLIAYNGPRGSSQATLLSKHQKTLPHAQSHSLQMVYKRKTIRQTWLECNVAIERLSEAVRKNIHAVAGGPSYGRFGVIHFKM